ncbi:hypothetical protein C2E23DRAFT_825691 [Lenzites betulinus]|nr:hypothetical protein C2E23DRAFT_825691 [Lenzites betulinus]
MHPTAEAASRLALHVNNPRAQRILWLLVRCNMKSSRFFHTCSIISTHARDVCAPMTENCQAVGECTGHTDDGLVLVKSGAGGLVRYSVPLGNILLSVYRPPRRRTGSFIPSSAFGFPCI